MVRTVSLISTMVAAGLATSAVGSTPVPGELLRDLSSQDVDARERATTQIAGRGDVKLKDLDAVLSGSKVSPEAFFRLLTAAKHKFENSPRGAMGVSFDLQGGLPNVVGKPLENFPSAKVLKPGDRIVEIDGWVLEDRQVDRWSGGTARPFIVSRDPGDIVPVKVIRDGQPVVLDLELGKFSDLKNNAPLQDSEIESAWSVRRVNFERSLPVVNGPAAGEDESSESVLFHDQQMGLEGMNGTLTPVAGGGQSQSGRTLDAINERLSARPMRRNLRDGFDPALNGQVFVRAGEVWVNGRKVHNGEMIGGARVIINNPPGQDARFTQMERQQLDMRIELLRIQLQEIDTKLKNEPMDELQKAAIQEMRRGFERMIADTEQERKLLDRRPVPKP